MIARAFLAGALALVPACAGVPSQFSTRSAASPQSPEPPRATIGVALREDPPLPGASTEGWAGLTASGGGGTSMGHMHHSDMDMQGMEGMDMQHAPDALPACMAGMDMGPCTEPDAGTGSGSHAY